MPTPAERKLAKDTELQLRSQGIAINLRYDPRPTAFWYRADGTQVGAEGTTKLPADAYHMKRYRAKGWTLVPPTPSPEAVDLGPVPVEEATTAATIKPHRHKYPAKKGSKCDYPGCPELRKYEFWPRKNRHKNKKGGYRPRKGVMIAEPEAVSAVAGLESP